MCKKALQRHDFKVTLAALKQNDALQDRKAGPPSQLAPTTHDCLKSPLVQALLIRCLTIQWSSKVVHQHPGCISATTHVLAWSLPGVGTLAAGAQVLIRDDPIAESAKGIKGPG
jgi:hypothetical protein